YMATVAAGPVFRLLGARDIGEKENYRTAKMPPVNTGLLDGELAWRQHDGGHEDRKSTRLNSSHLVISYAVFCLKKKKEIHTPDCHHRHDHRAGQPFERRLQCGHCEDV